MKTEVATWTHVFSHTIPLIIIQQSLLLLNLCSIVKIVSSISPDQAAREYQQQMPNLNVTRTREHNHVRLSQAKTNILAAQKKQKELYDKKHAQPERYNLWLVN